MMLAAEDCGTSELFQRKMGLGPAMVVSAYAPFYDEETDTHHPLTEKITLMKTFYYRDLYFTLIQ